MKDLIIIEQKPEVPTSWDYNKSVAKAKQYIYKWKDLTYGLAIELWVAREVLSGEKFYGNQWSGTKVPQQTWSDYCTEIGSSRQVVNRWLQRWFVPKELEKPDIKLLPIGTFSTIVVDPPWPIKKIERAVAPAQTKSILFDYPVMALAEIKALKIKDISADDCHCYLWTTQKYLPYSFEILEGWGFKYVFTMVWYKSGGFQPYNLPQYNCEFVLFGKKGNLPFITTKDFFTCFNGKRREHSRKPDEFYDVVRRVSPEPRIDIFSREPRKGFAQYGNETGKF